MLFDIFRTLFLPILALVKSTPVGRLHAKTNPTYTAGVVEFAPDTLLPTETPQQLIMRNAERYINIIETAANSEVDILVFPEYGLTSSIPMVREEALPYLTQIPDIGENPCNLKAPKVLETLSCAARKYKMYVVFNIGEVVQCSSGQSDCPSDGFLFYNTNLALDRFGKIVAKYRKFNLFQEPIFSVTEEPQYSYFDTDFGVRFGMFICFDIMFLAPTYGLLSDLKITNFVFSSQWVFFMPLAAPTSVQSAWAYANSVNLLAAGYSDTPEKQGGSGIYSGRNGQLIATMPRQSSTKLLIARVSPVQQHVDSAPKEITFTENSNTQLNVFHDNLEGFTSVLLEGKSKQLQYDNEGFHCNIKVEFSVSGGGSTYRLVAYNGPRLAFGMNFYVEICGIVSCADSTLSSCGNNINSPSLNVDFSKISISTSSIKPLLSLPITLNKNLLSLPNTPFKYESHQQGESSKTTMITTRPVNNVITFALFRYGSL